MNVKKKLEGQRAKDFQQLLDIVAKVKGTGAGRKLSEKELSVLKERLRQLLELTN